MIKKDAIIVCKNGAIAAWHPKRLFPFEFSLPIDIEKLNKEREVILIFF